MIKSRNYSVIPAIIFAIASISATLHFPSPFMSPSAEISSVTPAIYLATASKSTILTLPSWLTSPKGNSPSAFVVVVE